jgi:anaerobic magnesium-protoporphyrin IX monomethyl ester cyclase
LIFRGIILKIAIVQTPMWGVDVPSLGLAYLSAWLKERRHTVKVYDLNLELFLAILEKDKKYYNHQYNDFWDQKIDQVEIINQVIIDRWIKKILASNPDILCFPIFLTTREVSLKLAGKIKEMRPDILVVFGGPDCVEGRNYNQIVNSGCVDVIVAGEGEETILEIIEMWKKRDLKKCSGAIIIKGKEIIKGDTRPLIKNLDILPLPDYSDLNLPGYTLKHNFAIMMSRGCPMRCPYCSEGEYWKLSRTRSGRSVFSEMDYVSKRYGGKYFHFGDCMINTNIRQLESLCDLLIRNKTKVSWKVKVYPDSRLTYALMKKMHDAGCVTWELGVESGSDRLIREMGRHYTVSTVKEILKNGKKIGITINTFWMIGYPTETEEDFNKTLEFLSEIKDYIRVDPPCVSIFQLLPDTPFYKKLEAFGITHIERGNWYTKHFKNTLPIRKERYSRFFEMGNRLNLFNKNVHIDG